MFLPFSFCVCDSYVLYAGFLFVGAKPLVSLMCLSCVPLVSLLCPSEISNDDDDDDDDDDVVEDFRVCFYTHSVTFVEFFYSLQYNLNGSFSRYK